MNVIMVMDIKHFLSLARFEAEKGLFTGKFNEKTLNFYVKYTLRSPNCGGKLLGSDANFS